MGVPEVEDKFGVSHGQIVEYLALMGDAVDGIAGVDGIGKNSSQACRNMGRSTRSCCTSMILRAGSKPPLPRQKSGCRWQSNWPRLKLILNFHFNLTPFGPAPDWAAA